MEYLGIPWPVERLTPALTDGGGQALARHVEVWECQDVERRQGLRIHRCPGPVLLEVDPPFVNQETTGIH